MPEKIFVEPVELTDAELDLVTGGALVNVNAFVPITDVLSHNNILNNSNLQVAATVLGGLIGQNI